jgi:hypothetical protein
LAQRLGFRGLLFVHREEADRAPFGNGYWQTAAEKELIFGESWELFTWCQNSHQIEGIASGDSNQFARWAVAADRAKFLNRLRCGELLSRKPSDEATTADFSTCLQTVVDAEQLSPGWKACLTLEHLPEDDSPSIEELKSQRD